MSVSTSKKLCFAFQPFDVSSAHMAVKDAKNRFNTAGICQNYPGKYSIGNEPVNFQFDQSTAECFGEFEADCATTLTVDLIFILLVDKLYGASNALKFSDEKGNEVIASNRENIYALCDMLQLNRDDFRSNAEAVGYFEKPVDLSIIYAGQNSAFF